MVLFFFFMRILCLRPRHRPRQSRSTSGEGGNPVKVVEKSFLSVSFEDFGNHFYFACTFRNQSPRPDGPAAVNTTDCRFEYWLVLLFRIKVVVGRFSSGFLGFLLIRVLSRGV